MLNKGVQDVINKQVNAELSASYSYLAMSAWCDEANFTGAAKWFRMQSQEEYAHAMRLFDFVLARGGHVALTELKSPRGSYKTLLEVFETAYKQEQTVTSRSTTCTTWRSRQGVRRRRPGRVVRQRAG